MHDPRSPLFDPITYLANAGIGRQILRLDIKTNLFLQGDEADAVFYMQQGHAKLTVTSPGGKEACITLLSPGDFVGEESVGAIAPCRLATATTITPSSVLKIKRKEIMRVFHEERAFADLFLAFLLARSKRTQADLIDQLFNSSERRLARILLLMADYDKSSGPVTTIPKISQQTLAEMVGTTRARINQFMQKFRDHGFLEYSDGHIQVQKSLLNVLLYDDLSEQNASKPSLFGSGAKSLRE